jgi:hypothetical protein
MEKIKLFLISEKGKDILVVVIIILVGLGSFELGRLSKEDSQSGLKIVSTQAGDYSQNRAQGVNTASAVESVNNNNQGQSSQNQNSGKTFFASSRGSKYYTTSCSSGKTIKQENRVYFTTGEEAQAAGYTLSSSCN